MPDVDTEEEAVEDVGQGVVVLMITSLANAAQGYALAREGEWAADTEKVTIWRGPDKHDELFPRADLAQMTCESVDVDEDGFFTCLEPLSVLALDEDFQQLVESKSEEILNHYANEYAAESASYIHDGLEDDFGDDVWIVSSFGDATAVNGEWSDEHPKPPRGWKLTDKGGYDTSNEAEIELDRVVEALTPILEKELDRPLSQGTVLDTIQSIHTDLKDYIYWTSDSGMTEIWVSPAAFRAAEKREEEEEEEARKRRDKHRAEQHRLSLERQAKREEEEREKIKAGGWPRRKDWSPKGVVPPRRRRPR